MGLRKVSAVALGIFCCKSGLLTVAGGPLCSRGVSSVVAAHGLSCPASRGILVPRLTKARTRIPCVTRQILTHRRGGEAPAKESLFIPDPESLQSALQGPGTPTLSSAKGTVALGTHTVHMLDLQANHFIFGRFAFSAASAAEKSLQSCPTLCDPIDGSPPGSAVPGIPQVRTPEGVAVLVPSL